MNIKILKRSYTIHNILIIIKATIKQIKNKASSKNEQSFYEWMNKFERQILQIYNFPIVILVNFNIDRCHV